MVNPLLPEDVIVTINGSNITFDVFEYKETGGRKNITYTKTLHRHIKNVQTIPADWQISFSGTTTDLNFINLFDNNNLMTITGSWAGSMVITYNNAQSVSNNLSMNASDRLVFTSDFVVPFYDVNGSANRSVT